VYAFSDLRILEGGPGQARPATRRETPRRIGDALQSVWLFPGAAESYYRTHPEAQAVDSQTRFRPRFVAHRQGRLVDVRLHETRGTKAEKNFFHKAFMTQMDALGFDPVVSTPEDLATTLNNDIRSAEKLIKAIGLKPQ
jgi:hypothetical protein